MELEGGAVPLLSVARDCASDRARRFSSQWTSPRDGQSARWTLGRDPWESHVIVAIGLPFGFDLDNYPLFKGKSGTVERLIPRSVLNRFSRAVWPD